MKKMNLYDYHIQPETLIDYNHRYSRAWYALYTLHNTTKKSLTPEQIDTIKAQESIIAKNSFDAVQYAIKILNDRFILGEPAIAKDPNAAYLYAKHVLLPLYEAGTIDSPRFELGEPTIAKETDISYFYAKNVIQGEFELGEPAIAKEPFTAYSYAVHIIQSRFEMGEPSIAKSRQYSRDYNELFGTDL